MNMDPDEMIRREALRRGYSIRTIDTYCYCVKRFLNSMHKDIKLITKQEVKDYLYSRVERGASGNTINVYLQAIKFFFEECLRRKITPGITYSKTPREIPVFLTKEEIISIFEAVANQKHRLMLKLMYSAGLRVSELLSLKIQDLQIPSGYGWVRHGKGNKDRPFLIAQKLQQGLVE